MNAVVQSLRELSHIKLAALAGVAILLFGFFIFLSMRVAAPVMSPLYTGVSNKHFGTLHFQTRWRLGHGRNIACPR